MGLLLLSELIVAGTLLAPPPVAAPGSPPATAPASLTTPTAASATQTLRDGRTVHLVGLGGARTAPLLDRIAAQMDDAVATVTAFWGPNWPRDIAIVAAGSDAQFGSLAGGGADTAATATGERIMFAPGATAMSDEALRIVLRHELFHYASRPSTAVDAPRWLTEGVADFVARTPLPAEPAIQPKPAEPAIQPKPAEPANAAELAQIPTDADLAASGPARSLAYDRAWWFSRFVADQYGTATLRELYLRACGHGHPDAATAVRDSLGADLDAVLTRWGQWLTSSGR